MATRPRPAICEVGGDETKASVATFAITMIATYRMLHRAKKHALYRRERLARGSGRIQPSTPSLAALSCGYRAVVGAKQLRSASGSASAHRGPNHTNWVFVGIAPTRHGWNWTNLQLLIGYRGGVRTCCRMSWCPRSLLEIQPAPRKHHLQPRPTH